MASNTKKKAAPAKKNTEAEATTEHALCQCGCTGTPRGPKSRYLPGHDARHASALKKAEKEAAE